jgi:mxaA protein
MTHARAFTPIALRRILAIVAFLLALPLCAQPISITPVPPRSFGYTIGDRIERRVDIQLAAPWSLVHASLPTPGRQNAWLELVEVAVLAAAAPTGTHVELRLVYQLLNSPAQPTVLLLPRVALRFEGGMPPVEREVPQADVFAAPLLPAAAAGGTLDTPRADRRPETIPVEMLQQRLLAYALATALLLVFLFIARQIAQRRRAGPFVRACRELRRLAHAAPDTGRSDAAMRVVHRALDETAGHTVFLDNLETLFASPYRAPLRERTSAFLHRSRQQFFAGTGAVLTLEELRELARAWRGLETTRR